MKFEEAMKHLREGKTITLKDSCASFSLNSDLLNTTFDLEDILSGKWEVVEPKVTIMREQLIEAVKGISETREYALSHGIDRILNGWSKEVANKIADKLGL